MALVEVGTVSSTGVLNIRPIIGDVLVDSSTRAPVEFDATKHLAYTDRPKVLLMKDLELPEDVGISPVAVSEPFPLFTEEAIRIMRGEIFTKEVWDHCLQSTAFASCQLRGHCPK